MSSLWTPLDLNVTDCTYRANNLPIRAPRKKGVAIEAPDWGASTWDTVFLLCR